MRILVTGFEPFGGSDINSSWETAARLEMQSFDGIELIVKKLETIEARLMEIQEKLNKE